MKPTPRTYKLHFRGVLRDHSEMNLYFIRKLLLQCATLGTQTTSTSPTLRRATTRPTSSTKDNANANAAHLKRTSQLAKRLETDGQRGEDLFDIHKDCDTATVEAHGTECRVVRDGELHHCDHRLASRQQRRCLGLCHTFPSAAHTIVPVVAWRSVCTRRTCAPD